MYKKIISIAVLALVSSFLQGQTPDSTAIQVYPRTDVLYDSLSTVAYTKQYETQNLLFIGAQNYTFFIGANFGFGTIFNADIKSNYPGFIGFGSQGGIKLNNGFIIEGAWRFNRFQRNVNYVYFPSSNNNLRYEVGDGAFDMNHFDISLLYTDYRSPFIAFRYFYFGIGMGVVNIYEQRRLTQIETIGGHDYLTQSNKPFSQWNPNLSLIFGMNFLYQAQRQNWFSIDVRFDYSFNNKQSLDGTIFSKNRYLAGINTTVRFYFDLMR